MNASRITLGITVVSLLGIALCSTPSKSAEPPGGPRVTVDNVPLPVKIDGTPTVSVQNLPAVTIEKLPAVPVGRTQWEYKFAKPVEFFPPTAGGNVQIDPPWSNYEAFLNKMGEQGWEYVPQPTPLIGTQTNQPDQQHLLFRRPR